MNRVFLQELTRAATPLWAGIAVDINNYLTAQNKPTLGTANALLYQVFANPSPYYPTSDITSGCNGSNGTSNGGFCAGRGYDLVTGMGSPLAFEIALDLNAQIATNVESDIVWGEQNGTTIDLMQAYTQSSAPSWHTTNVSASMRSLTGKSLSLTPNAGQPGAITYQTSGEGTQADVFALATFVNTPTLFGFTYLQQSGSWTPLYGLIAPGNPLPAHNPVAVAVGAPSYRAVALFGVSSAGHLIEYFLNNSDRVNIPANPNAYWVFQDITAMTGVSCDPGVSPTATVYNAQVVVFADCGNRLVDFYTNSQGHWQSNTGITGNSIPNASHAFPYHSLATLVVPGSPAALEAYVASDQNGASTLDEYLYTGASWAHFTLSASGHAPDQVYAQTVGVSYGKNPAPISEVIATDPASTSCGSLPAAVQYLYQPQVPNPGWKTAVVASGGVTGMYPIVEGGGPTLTEAFTGAYTGTATRGAAGGGGCGYNGILYEDFSVMSAATTQTWSANTANGAPVDTSGIEPTGFLLPY